MNYFFHQLKKAGHMNNRGKLAFPHHSKSVACKVCVNKGLLGQAKD